MNIGEAQVAALVAVHLFDEFFRALHRTGVIPAVSSNDQPTPLGVRNVTVRLQPPTFELGGPATDPRSLLHLLGDVELRPAGISGGPADATLPLDSWVRLTIVLVPRPDETPVIRLVYDGVDQPPAFPLTEAMIDNYFTSPETQAILAGVELDVVSPIVDSLEVNLFPDDPPARDSWPVALRLRRATDDDHVDALAIQVALPGDASDGGDERSHLPTLTEFGVIYSRQLLNTVLAAEAAAMVNTEVNDATITDLSLVMQGDALQVNGRAEQDTAVITFLGPVRVRLLRGTTQFAADSSQIAVNVDLPWWTDLLLFLSGPLGGLFTFGLGPLLGGIILASQGTSLGEVETDIAAAPFRVRGAITTALSDGLSALAEGLALDAGVGDIQPDSTPDHSRVVDGHIAIFAQMFVNRLTAGIVDGLYFHQQRRIGELQLAGGRWFAATELARLGKGGFITTPGYHAVERPLADDEVRRYMRANPDDSHNNNLLRRFGPG